MKKKKSSVNKILVPLILLIGAGGVAYFSVSLSQNLNENTFTGNLEYGDTEEPPFVDTGNGDSSTEIGNNNGGSGDTTTTDPSQDDTTIGNTGANASNIQNNVYDQISQHLLTLYDKVNFYAMDKEDVKYVYVDLDSYTVSINGTEKNELLTFKTDTSTAVFKHYMNKLQEDAENFSTRDINALVDSFSKIYSIDTYKNIYDLESSSFVSDTTSYVFADKLNCDVNTLDTKVNYTLANIPGNGSEKYVWVNAYSTQNDNGHHTVYADTNSWLVSKSELADGVEQYLLDQATAFVNGQQSIFNDMQLNRGEYNITLDYTNNAELEK